VSDQPTLGRVLAGVEALVEGIASMRPPGRRMNDEPQVLDYLREQFARVHTALADIKEIQREHTSRLGRLERGLADVQVQLAEFSVRLDRFGAHVERIERRLDLVEGPAA